MFRYFDLRAVLLVLAITMSVACSSGNHQPESSGNIQNIQLAQALIPSLPDRVSISYLAVMNSGNEVVSGLTYAASESMISIPQGQCTSLIPGQTCALKLQVSAGVNAFTSVSVLQTGQNVSVSGAFAINLVAYHPAISGANAVSLILPSSVQGNESSLAAQVVINAVVSGSGSGIESIGLNYANQHTLQAKLLRANNFKVLGGNGSNYSTGDIISFIGTFPVVATNSVAIAPVITSLVNNNLTVVTGNAQPLQLISANAGGTLAFYPQQLTLTSGESGYTVELMNNAVSDSGNLTITNLTASSSVLQISNDNCSGHDLRPSEHCTYLLQLNPQNTLTGSGSITINYTSGGGDSIAVNQIIDYHLLGAPGLTLFDPANFSFATTQQTPIAHEISLINSGAVEINNINFNVPAGFSLAPTVFGGTNQPCTLINQQIITLATGASCGLLLTYDGQSNQTTSVATLLTSFSYGNSQTASISQNIIYKTIPMGAILNLSPSVFVYPNIKSNHQESTLAIFYLSNVGSAPATAINIINQLGVFQLINNNCTANLNPGASCSFGVQFGPTAESMTYNSQVNIQYRTDLAGGGTGVISGYLSGTSYAVTGADISLSSLSLSPNPLSGDGKTSNSAYQVLTNKSYQVMISYTNSAADSARNFTINTASLSNQYGVVSNGCNNITLNRGSSCQLALNVVTSSNGSNDLLLNSLVASWSDNSGSHTARLAWQNQYTMYLNVNYLTPLLSFNPESAQITLKANNSDVQSSSFSVLNRGNYSAVLGSPSLSPSLSWAHLTSDCNAMLNPAESCVVTVFMGPTSVVTTGSLNLILPYSGGSGGESSITSIINYQTTASVITQIQSGYFQGAGLDQLGHAWWWGWVVGGSTPVPCTDCGGAYFVPTAIVSNLNFSVLSGQYAHDCGLVNLSGDAYCWGNGKYGALGNNSTANSTIPVAVSGGNTYSKISTGYRSSCAIDINSQLWCWGRNTQGQLGTGDFVSSSVPVTSASGSFTRVSAGYNFTCAIKSDGSAWCFGDNEVGQLGNGSAVPCANSNDCSASYVNSPVAVVGGHDFIAIATAADGYVNDPNSPVGHACAIDINQDMYCWGSNLSGQLGGGSVSSCTNANPSSCTATPQLVLGGHKYVFVTAGAGYSCGVDTAHHAWCWGQNQNGQLGVGSLTSPVLTPTAVSGNLEFSQLSGSFTANTCGVDTTGKSWCWGSNKCGQLGFTSIMTLDYCASGTPPSEFPYQVSVPTLVNESGFF